MGINRVNDRKGRPVIEVRKRWPDGKEFRRFFANRTLAKRVLARIEASIAEGCWQELRDRLTDSGGADALTIAAFSQRFMEEYAKPRLASWQRYELSFASLNRRLGELRMDEFSRRHLHRYVKERVGEVAAATVNKDIAAVRKMFSYAVETGVIERHPLVRFPMVRVQEAARRILTVGEFRALVAGMDRSPIAAMTAVMGETGIRKGEALSLRWENIDLDRRILTAARTKSRRVRHIPLTDYAIHWLSAMVRWRDCPDVFVSDASGEGWINPEKAFRRGAVNAGLAWVGFHDLRRFRATQWIRHGVDLRTVKELLGHRDIKTTMRYAHFVPEHAAQSILAAQALEARELDSERVING